MGDRHDREQRREERLEAEAQAAGADRRRRLLQLSAGGVFLAIIIVVVIIVVAGSGGGSDNDGGEPSNLRDVAEVEKLLAGIPQSATVLGKPGAPVKLFEYGDLQCPFCKENAETVTPAIIENAIRGGEASLTFRNFIIIGPDSIPAGEAALAAGAQGKGWNFIELWYRNQGEENSGYVTEAFIESIGKGAGIPDIAQWNKERKSKKYKKQLEETTKQAEKLGFEATPSFAIEGPGSEGLELLGTPESSGQLEAAIKKAG
ncbi:MAG TPA: thioredoxin domain-containing protein [Solirubrobacterales bacterium]|nr:thioredoxin domain-containing protein [Solirubrobacterales bacterium]